MSDVIPGRVKVGYIFKKKMKVQYEMLDIVVGVEFDGDVNAPEIWEKAWDIVDTQLDNQLKELADG